MTVRELVAKLIEFEMEKEVLTEDNLQICAAFEANEKVILFFKVNKV